MPALCLYCILLLVHKKLKWKWVVCGGEEHFCISNTYRSLKMGFFLRDLKIDMWCCFRLHCPDTLRCYTWHHQYEYRPCAATDVQAVSAILQLAWHYQSSCSLPGEYCVRHKWLAGMAGIYGVIFFMKYLTFRFVYNQQTNDTSTQCVFLDVKRQLHVVAMSGSHNQPVHKRN